MCRDEQGEEEAGGDRSARQTLAVAGFDPAFSQALDVFQSLTVANCDAPLMLCCILLSSMESLPVEVWNSLEIRVYAYDGAISVFRTLSLQCKAHHPRTYIASWISFLQRSISTLQLLSSISSPGSCAG